MVRGAQLSNSTNVTDGGIACNISAFALLSVNCLIAVFSRLYAGGTHRLSLDAHLAKGHGGLRWQGEFATN